MSNQEHLTPNPDFDWGMYEKGTTLSEAARKEQEAKYEETLNSLKVNEVVIGKVVEFVKNDKTIREVLVDVGYKSLGVVPYTEFRYNQDLKIGDEVEVYVISQEDRSGALVLSHRQARLERAWERINEAQEKDEVILGFIKSRTKGGMIVDVFGVEAFLPGSQIDVRPIRDYDALIDKTMEFKIVKINQEQKNVVVSHKILVEAELEQQKRDIISKLEKGQVLEGTVKNILPFGVFVDLGGVDGLIHITDLSWERVSHPSEVVELDQKINVVILDFDENKTRIALGLKQLTPDPWADIEERYPVGSRHQAKVRNFTNFGVFVEIEEGVDGLIHLSDLSWTKKVKHPSEVTEIGAMIEVEVLEIDKENRRLSLGHKQTEENPWDAFEDTFTVGSIHEGVITEIIDNKGAVVALPYGIEGFATQKHLVKEDGSKAQVDEKLPFKVLEFNKEKHRIIVSHSRTFEDKQRSERASEGAERKPARRAEETAAQAPVEKATLGDLGALAALRDQLDENN